MTVTDEFASTIFKAVALDRNIHPNGLPYPLVMAGPRARARATA